MFCIWATNFSAYKYGLTEFSGFFFSNRWLYDDHFVQIWYNHIINFYKKLNRMEKLNVCVIGIVTDTNRIHVIWVQQAGVFLKRR